jgi:hypothetical protein
MEETDEKTVHDDAVSLLAGGVVALALEQARKRLDARARDSLPLATSPKGSVRREAPQGHESNRKDNS